MSISGANANAAAQTTNECGSAVGSCPFEQAEIQLIPMRYAISEESEQLPAQFNGSLYKDSKTCQGMRPLNEGYLYLIHDSDLKMLYEYKVAADNSVVGRQYIKGDADFTENYLAKIFVPASGKLSALFMPLPLSAERADILLTAYSDQSKIMNSVYLSTASLANGSKGLIPIGQLSSAIDFSAERKESESQNDFGQYLWIEDGGLKAELKSTIQSSVIDDKNAAILLVNDICADIAEGAAEINATLEQYHQYSTQEINGHSNIDRYEIGQAVLQVSTLSSYVDGQIQALINDLNLQINSDEKKAEFIEDLEAFNKILTDKSNQSAGHSRVNKKAQAYAKTIQSKYASTETDNTAFYVKIKGCCQDYKLFTDGNAIGKRGLKDVIRYDDMTTFIAEWEDYQAAVMQRAQDISGYIKQIPAKWHLFACYIDPLYESNPVQGFLLKLDYEDTLLLALRHIDREWLKKYYTGDHEQPLFIYDDIAAPSVLASSGQVVKETANIYKKYRDIDSKMTKASKLQDKIKMGNQIIEGTAETIAAKSNLRLRAQQSLALKNELFFEKFFAKNSSVTVGAKLDYTSRLDKSISQWSTSQHSFVAKMAKFNGLEWSDPQIQAIQDYEKLATKKVGYIQQLTRLNRQIKKLKNNRRRKLKKKALPHKIAKSKSKLLSNQLTQVKAQINECDIKINQLKTSALSPLVAAAGKGLDGFEVAAEVREARIYLNNTYSKIALTTKGLVTDKGKFDVKKAKINSAKVALFFFYNWSAFEAWENVCEGELEEGEILNAVSATFASLSADISLVMMVYEASVDVSLSIRDAKYTLQLNELTKWLGFSSVISNMFGTVVLGIKFLDYAKDFLHDFNHKNNSVLFTTLSLLRTVGQGVLLATSLTEASLNARAIIVFVKNIRSGMAMAEAMGTLTSAVLSNAARFARFNFCVWIALYAIDKLYNYYKLPKIAAWAEQSLWGIDDQQWDLEQHYNQFSAEKPTPMPSYYIDEWQGSKNSGLMVSMFIPGACIRLSHPQLNTEQFKYSLTASGYHSNALRNPDTVEVAPLYGGDFIREDLRPYLDIENLNVEFLQGGTKLTFVLPNHWLYAMKAFELYFKFYIREETGDWQQIDYVLDISHYAGADLLPEVTASVYSGWSGVLGKTLDALGESTFSLIPNRGMHERYRLYNNE